MKLTKFFLPLTLATTLFSGCHRDELCFQHPEGAKMQIVAKYDDALAPDKSYIAIYNQLDGTLVREEMMKSPLQHETYLDLGEYYIMVYNEPLIEGTFTTANTVMFSNKTRWNEVMALAVTDHSAAYTLDENTRAVTNIQEQLAVDRMRFNVTPDMIKGNHTHPTPIGESSHYVEPDTTIRFYPKRVFTKVNIEVEAINYSGWTLRRTNGNRPIFAGASNHYLMGLNSYAATPSSQYVDFINGDNFYNNLYNNTTYTCFRSTFYTVGLQNDRMPTIENSDPYTLFFRFEHGSPDTPLGIEILPITVNLVSGANAESATIMHTRAGEPHPLDGARYHNDILDIKVTLLLPKRIPIGDGTDIDIDDWENEDVPLDSPPSIYFHPNGAEGEIFRWKYPVGTTLYLPHPANFTSPTDYRFKEWNTKNDSTGMEYQPETPYPMPRGGITLFAIWEKIRDK